ncbi:MAG: hypothetical protein IKR92_02125 [Alphaproteobacteria bacterium]|nr:hypothetical protein [Alphaproteobacteria bacterium]
MTQDMASINDIVNQLYDVGKICLTAYAGVDMDKKYRPYLAQFADGTFLVDARAENDVALLSLSKEFCEAYPSARRKARQFVSAEVLKAVYRKAQEFDWYEPQYASWKDLTAAERAKMRQFWWRMEDKICLSVTTITTPEVFRFYSPDKGKFALFADGWLAMAENTPYADELPKALSALHPETNMVEVVPPHYVDMVYDFLLYRQPSAREIYIDLCRQKMSRRRHLSLAEAQEVMEKQTWGWRRLLLLDEKTARSMIYSEFVEKSLAAEDEQWAQIMEEKKEYCIGTIL